MCWSDQYTNVSGNLIIVYRYFFVVEGELNHVRYVRIYVRQLYPSVNNNVCYS